MKFSVAPTSIAERWKFVRWSCAALILVFVGSFLNLLRFGDYPALSLDSLIVAGILAALAIIVGVLSGLGRIAMWFVSGLAAYFAVLLNAPGLWPLAWGAVVAFLAWRAGLMPLKFLVVIFGVVAISSITLPNASRFSESGEKRPNGSGSPIVYIILDETGGETELENARVWKSAWARHTSSKESIAEIYDGHFEKLAASGYSTEFWLADWAEVCQDYCLTYNQFAVSAVRVLDKRSERVAALLGGFRSLIPDGNWIESFWPRSIHTYFAIPVNSLQIMDTFSDRVAKMETGEALLLHVIFPHDPYVLDANCTLLPSSQWGSRLGAGDVSQWKSQHARQFRCAEKMVNSIIERRPDVTFIVHGDHGDRIFDYRTRAIGTDKTMLESFLALRVPGEVATTYNEEVYLGDLIRSFALSEFSTIPPPAEVTH